MKSKEIAKEFFTNGIEWATEVKFGNPSNAKEFNQYWKEFKKKYKIVS